jgi:integrase
MFTLATIERYLRDRSRLGELAPASVVVSRWCLCSLHAQTGDVALGEITRGDLEQWLTARDRRPSSVKSMLTKVRPFFGWCLAHELIARNPADPIRAPRVGDGLPRVLEPLEVAQVLGACPDPRAATVVMLLVQCGLRIGEVARLRVDDIDRRRRVALIRGKGGRGGITRSVPLPAECLEQLNRYPGARRTGPIIASYQPPYGPVSAHWLGRLVSQWMLDAGVKHEARDGRSAHAFRHTMAQDLVDAGKDPRVVQRALGHKSMRTTEDYWRRDPPGMREALEGRRYT